MSDEKGQLNLKDLPTAELQAELARREEIARVERKRRDEERRALIYQNLPFILKLVPNHSRNSCSDENPRNPHRCTRCTLIDAQSSSYDEMTQFDIVIDIHN